MDRRRFVPGADGLEARQLLSTVPLAAKATQAPTSSLQQRSVRIDRLPIILEALQPGRFVPGGTVAKLQDDLRSIQGQLRAANPARLSDFTNLLRGTIGHASIREDDVQRLDAAFGRVLESADASPQVVARFRDDMRELAVASSQGVNSGNLVSNDYSTVLQIALGIGRPLRAPKAPRLLATDDTGKKGDGATTVAQPRLFGTYDAGATIEVLDASTNAVLGTTTVGTNGQYVVGLTKPLSEGRHVLRVQAGDANGGISLLSPPLVLTIQSASAARTSSTLPGGPLATARGH